MRTLIACSVISAVASGLYAAQLGAPFMSIAVTFCAIACVRGSHAQA